MPGYAAQGRGIAILLRAQPRRETPPSSGVFNATLVRIIRILRDDEPSLALRKQRFAGAVQKTECRHPKGGCAQYAQSTNLREMASELPHYG